MSCGLVRFDVGAGGGTALVRRKCQKLGLRFHTVCTVFPEYQAANDTAKNDKVERPVNVLFRRDDHSNDLIVHFFNEVSRLLDCDSAQDFKAEGYRCQKRDSVMEHFHLNQGLSPSGFPQIEATRAAFAVGHKNSSITRPAELVSSVVQGVRYAAPLIGISLLQFNLGGDCLSLRHSTTIKHFRFVIKGEEMRNVYTFAGLTFALALAFSLTTAAQTSSTESKQPASPDQRQADSAGNMHRDRVGERLKWLSQQLNLTEDQKKELKPILAGEFKHNESGGRRRITDSRPKARKDEANP